VRFIAHALETGGRLVYKTGGQAGERWPVFLPDNQRNCRGLNES